MKCIPVAALFAAIIAPSFATGADNLKFATREQYRACLDSEERVNALRKKVDEHLAENNGEMFLLQTEATTLVNDQKSVSPFDESQVNAFNKRMEEHNSRVKAANERAEKLKIEQEDYNAESTAHNKKCAALVVRLVDREAVLKERKTAGNKGTGSYER